MGHMAHRDGIVKSANTQPTICIQQEGRGVKGPGLYSRPRIPRSGPIPVGSEGPCTLGTVLHSHYMAHSAIARGYLVV